MSGRKPNARYCNRKCLDASRRVPFLLNRSCEYCGKPLTPHEWASKRMDRPIREEAPSRFNKRRVCNQKCFIAMHTAAVNRPEVVAQRYWSKVNKDGPVVREDLGPCWIWRATKCRDGYGRFQLSDKSPVLASRMSWLLTFLFLPKELCVLHKCDYPPCVRPDHLFLGTKADNARDMVAKGRNVPGRRVDEMGRETIREARSKGVSARDLSKRYGLSESTIYGILAGKQWGPVS